MLSIPLNLLDVDKAQRESASEPIEFDYSSTIIAAFLDLAMVAHPNASHLSFQICQSLYNFVEQFDCQRLLPLVHRQLFASASATPFQLFIFASTRDDWDLGRAALARMNEQTTTRLYTNGLAQHLNQLPMEWQLALLKSLVHHDIDTGKVVKWNWSGLALTFGSAGNLDMKRMYSGG